MYAPAVVALIVACMVVAVIGVLINPRWAPLWLIPLVCAVIVILSGEMSLFDAGDAVRPLTSPLVFLLFAVPLSLMLDRLGFFAAAAAKMDRGKDPRLGLWILAAAVTTFLNLDAAVVLLTPLYIRIARRHGMNVRLIAFIPVLLASLASSTLPVSNLTNLIAAAQLDLTAAQFLTRLAVPTLVSVIVGWLVYRRLDGHDARGARLHDPVDYGALRKGMPVVVLVVVGFTFGEFVHVPVWVVAAIADVYLFALTRNVSYRDLPVGSVILVLSLGVIATAVVPILGIESWLRNGDALSQARIAALGIIGANTINNLPMTLVGVSAIEAGTHVHDVWPLLFGVNKGPLLMLHASLAGLLWRDTARRMDVEVTPWEYSRIGVRVGVPAIAVSLAMLLSISYVVGG